MESPENKNLSFVIRIWSEESEPTVNRPWRGRIVSIHDDQQYLYFQHLWQLLLFIAPFLSASGLHVHWSTRLIVWFLKPVRSLIRLLSTKRERDSYGSGYGEGTSR